MYQKRSRGQNSTTPLASASNTPKQPSKKQRINVLVASSPVTMSSVEPQALDHPVLSARRELDFNEPADPLSLQVSQLASCFCES